MKVLWEHAWPLVMVLIPFYALTVITGIADFFFIIGPAVAGFFLLADLRDHLRGKANH